MVRSRIGDFRFRIVDFRLRFGGRTLGNRRPGEGRGEVNQKGNGTRGTTVVLFLEQATEVLVGELEEEPEGTGLPGVGLRREAKHLASVGEEEALMDQTGDIQVEVGEEVVVEGLVEGIEAAAEEEAAVVAAAGERRRRRMSPACPKVAGSDLGREPRPTPAPPQILPRENRGGRN
jgi:hypothetical protein